MSADKAVPDQIPHQIMILRSMDSSVRLIGVPFEMDEDAAHAKAAQVIADVKAHASEDPERCGGWTWEEDIEPALIAAGFLEVPLWFHGPYWDEE